MLYCIRTPHIAKLFPLFIAVYTVDYHIVQLGWIFPYIFFNNPLGQEN